MSNNFKSYLQEKALRNRINTLEKFIIERAALRNGKESRAYIIWKLLCDQGPMTRPQVRALAKYTQPLLDLEREGAVTKTGNLYTAVEDFSWEDLPATSKLTVAGDTTTQSNDTVINNGPEEVAPRRRGRSSTVNPDIFSSKLAEVKAAVENGENVNQQSSDRDKATPLVKMCNKKSQPPEAEAIVHYLLEHGANPNAFSGTVAVIYKAIDNCSPEIIIDLVNHGANLKRQDINNNSPFYYALKKAASGSFKSYDVLPHLLGDIENYNPVDFNSYICPKICDKLVDYGIMGELPISVCKELTTIFYTRCKPEIKKHLLTKGGASEDLISEHPYAFEIACNNDIIPNLDGYVYDVVTSNQTLKVLYNCMANALKRGSDTGDPFALGLTFMRISNKLRNESATDKLISEQLGDKFAEGLLTYGDIFIVSDTLIDLYKRNYIFTLKIISKHRVTNSGASRNTHIAIKLINYVLDDSSNSTVSVYIAKIIHNLLANGKDDSYFGTIMINNVYRNNNTSLIEVLLEYNILPTCPTKELSKTAQKLIASSGAERQDNNTARDKAFINEFIPKIIRRINDETWSAALENVITQHPEILFDKRIQDALDKADDDNATARQLLRRIEQLPKSVKDKFDDVYDM